MKSTKMRIIYSTSFDTYRELSETYPKLQGSLRSGRNNPGRDLKNSGFC